jgi:hypothetical protein
MHSSPVAYLLAEVLLGVGPAALAAGENPAPFDGLWNVTLTCPPHNDDEDAKGYVHRFPAEVKASEFRGTHAGEGQPGWHLLTGTIAQDGNANLTLEGIVNNPNYAVNHAFRGKPYSYRVRAKFEASTGSGHRVGKHKCDFEFKRQ